jgi:predicted amidohydrolase
VFPEPSLTGYVLDADKVDIASGAFDPVVDACAATGATALVGAPVHVDGGRRIAVVAVTDVGAAVAYCKVRLGGTRSDTSLPVQGLLIEVRGRRVGLGVCKDTRPPSTSTLSEHVRPRH